MRDKALGFLARVDRVISLRLGRRGRRRFAGCKALERYLKNYAMGFHLDPNANIVFRNCRAYSGNAKGILLLREGLEVKEDIYQDIPSDIPKKSQS